MSTNITSTNDPVAVDAPGSAPVPNPAERTYENPFAAIGSLPDPSVIARLANEFFAALPRVPLSENVSPSPVSTPEGGASVPGISDPATLTPFTAEPVFSPSSNMFSFPAVPTGVEKAQPVE